MWLWPFPRVCQADNIPIALQSHSALTAGMGASVAHDRKTVS